MESERYPTDLKDEEWAIIARLFTKSEKRGKKPNNDMRRIVDGCFYLLRGGISWVIAHLGCGHRPVIRG